MLISLLNIANLKNQASQNQTGRINNQHFLLCAITKIINAFKLE